MLEDRRISFTHDCLVGQIIEGRKTASATALDEQGDLDEWDHALFVGQVYTVYDSKRTPRCRIRITRIQVCRWDAIPDWLWIGETNSNADEFREDHVSFFNDPTDDFEFAGYEFELLD